MAGAEDFFFTYDHGLRRQCGDGRWQRAIYWLGNRSPEDLRKLLQIGGFKEEEIDFPATSYGAVRA